MRDHYGPIVRLAAAALLAASLSACAGNMPKIGETTASTGELAAGSGATKPAPPVPVGPKTSTHANSEAEQAGATIKPAGAPPRTVANDEANIVGFRGATVVLYSTETGNEGERVPAASLPIPLRVHGAPGNSSRLTIPTAKGARWISSADVVLGPQ